MKKLQWVISIFFLGTSLLTLTSISKATADEIPEPECIKGGIDDSACGYNCVRSGTDVGCAEWPGGKCVANIDGVACGPPAPANWDRSYRRGDGDRNHDDDYDRDEDYNRDEDEERDDFQ
jgi:hypothetical protein